MRLLSIILCAWALGCGSKPPAATAPAPSCVQPDSGCAICNGDGRVVAVVQPGDFLSLHDDPAVIARSGPTPLGSGDTEWTIAVSDGEVRAQVLTCPHCRRQMGWSIRIDLAALATTDEETRIALQASLGWPASPLLTAEDDWRTPPPAPPADGTACPR
jgi:hypothetical protein